MRNRKPYGPVKNPNGYLPPEGMPGVGELVMAYFVGKNPYLTRVDGLLSVKKIEKSDTLLGWWPAPQEATKEGAK